MTDLQQSLLLGVYFVGAIVTACLFWRDSGHDLAFDRLSGDGDVEAGVNFVMGVFCTLVFAVFWPFLLVVGGTFWVLFKVVGKIINALR